MKSTRTIPELTLLGLVVTLVACGPDSGTPPPVPEFTVITAPLRVHVLSSSFEELHSSVDDADVREMIDRVNEIWTPAAIRFELESIVRESTLADDQIEAERSQGLAVTPLVLTAALPIDRLSDGAWDAFIVKDLDALSGFPGIYMRWIPALIASEIDPEGVGDPARILAHELGHSLTLPHVACTSRGNLMSPNCPSQNRVRLTDSQIERARRHAADGRPDGA